MLILLWGRTTYVLAPERSKPAYGPREATAFRAHFVSVQLLPFYRCLGCFCPTSVWRTFYFFFRVLLLLFLVVCGLFFFFLGGRGLMSPQRRGLARTTETEETRRKTKSRPRSSNSFELDRHADRLTDFKKKSRQTDTYQSRQEYKGIYRDSLEETDGNKRPACSNYTNDRSKSWFWQQSFKEDRETNSQKETRSPVQTKETDGTSQTQSLL